MSSPHLPPRGGNPKKKKGKHRRPRPEGGFDDSGT